MFFAAKSGTSPRLRPQTTEDVRVQKLEGKTVLTATLSLHGQKKKVTGAAELQQKDGKIGAQPGATSGLK